MKTYLIKIDDVYYGRCLTRSRNIGVMVRAGFDTIEAARTMFEYLLNKKIMHTGFTKAEIVQCIAEEVESFTV